MLYIPQIGNPRVFLQTIDLIYRGVNKAKDLAIQTGSDAKKDVYLTRRGDYLGRPLIEFDLATRVRSKEERSSVYELTDKGYLIAVAKEQETRERLIAEALLSFYPIQIILEKITRDGQELSHKLIGEVINELTLNAVTDCSGATKPRRSQSLHSLVNWVARWAGIPICRKGEFAVQLYIPNIYANNNAD